MTLRSSGILRILGALYILAGGMAVIYPSECLYFLNIEPKVFHFTDAMPESLDRLWSVFAASQFATLAGLCFLAAESPKIRGYHLMHCLAKLIAAVSFFYFFFNSQAYFIYLLGGTVESVLFAVVLACFLASFKTHKKKVLGPSSDSTRP